MISTPSLATPTQNLTTPTSTNRKHKPMSKTMQNRLHRESASSISFGIQIKKSQIVDAGSGAFTSQSIKRGECVVFYEGLGGVMAEDDGGDYVMSSSTKEASRNGFDVDGPLSTITSTGVNGVKVNCHAWSSSNWSFNTLSTFFTWQGVSSNWIRFMNHTGGDLQNITLCFDSRKMFRKAFIFYAKRDIEAGEELFYNYGKHYWTHRKTTPSPPLLKSKT